MPDMTLKVPAIEKLLDLTASGVGAIAGPILAPWRASREGKARLTSARFDADARRIQAESDAGTLQIIADAQAKARQHLVASDERVRGTAELSRGNIAQSIEFQGRKRLANVISVVEHAADELGDKEVSDHAPDPNWTARFFNEIQDVSSEDMQKIWANILAGEVESPGRTSLRTLDTLRNLTKRYAEMFKSICGLVISHHCVFYNDSVKNLGALNYSNLLHLEECGLINVVPNLVSKFVWDGQAINLAHHNGSLALSKEQTAEAVKDQLEIPVFVLTTAGQELFQFTETDVNMEYLQSFATFLKSDTINLAYVKKVEPPPETIDDCATITLFVEPESGPVEEPTP